MRQWMIGDGGQIRADKEASHSKDDGFPCTRVPSGSWHADEHHSLHLSSHDHCYLVATAATRNSWPPQSLYHILLFLVASSTTNSDFSSPHFFILIHSPCALQTIQLESTLVGQDRPSYHDPWLICCLITCLSTIWLANKSKKGRSLVTYSY